MAKSFLNLDKQMAKNGLFKKIIVDDQKITSQSEVNNQIHHLFQKLFKQNIFKTNTEKSSFSEEPPLPKLKSDFHLPKKIVLFASLKAL